MFSTIALSLALQIQPQWLEIGYAQDRCSMQGCIAEVSIFEPKPQIVEKQTKEQISLFYEEDGFYLHYELRKKIRDFLDSHSTQDKFIVTGFTDGCGDHSYNRQLSHKRANEVARYIMSIRQGVLVELQWKGEATGKHTIRARRVEVAIYDKERIEITPPKIIYDYYLIDGSGSMSGGKWNKWTNAIAYWKPRGAKVFVATTDYIPPMARLNHINPSGNTEIYFALWTLLDRMQPGQTLVVISDFRASVALSGRELQRIEQKIREKQVKVSDIRL
jgi:outer membrane protein OmpA-like peptidoglycan-associated protein